MGNEPSKPNYTYEEVQKYIAMKNKIKNEQEKKVRLEQEKKMKEFQKKIMEEEQRKKQTENVNQIINNIQYEQHQSILGNIDEDEFMKMTRNVSKVREKNNNQHYLNQGTIDYNPYPENYDIDDEEELDEEILIVNIDGKKYNAMKILGLDLNTDDKELRKKYFKLAQKHHPDKGGNPRKFMIIHRCYLHIKSLLEGENHDHSQLKRDTENYISTQISKEMVNDAFGKGKNFDIKKFNSMFENTRISNPYDKGYGDMINDEYDVNQETIKRDYSLGNPTSLNKRQFERKFQKQKQKYQKPKNDFQLQVYQGINTSIRGLGFQELGQGEINDFTSGENDPFAFTDYKKAYGESSVLIDPESVQQRASYRNIEEYNNARSDLTLNKDERRRIAQAEKIKKQKIIQQRRLLRKQDQIEARKFHHINKMLLKDRK